MITWRVWGYENNKKLKILLVAANSFDEAIKEAREKNPNYNTAQPTEGKHEIENGTFRMG